MVAHPDSAQDRRHSVRTVTAGSASDRLLLLLLLLQVVRVSREKTTDPPPPLSPAALSPKRLFHHISHHESYLLYQSSFSMIQGPSAPTKGVATLLMRARLHESSGVTRHERMAAGHHLQCSPSPHRLMQRSALSAAARVATLSDLLGGSWARGPSCIAHPAGRRGWCQVNRASEAKVSVSLCRTPRAMRRPEVEALPSLEESSRPYTWTPPPQPPPLLCPLTSCVARSSPVGGTREGKSG